MTFKNSQALRDIARDLPADRLLVETDAPYLAPVPYRGERNDSSYLPLVVSKIAQIKGISEEEVIRVTEENAKRLFGME